MNPTKTISPLLKISEVAQRIGVNDATVRSWIKAEKLAAVKLPGGDLRIREAHLEAWLNHRTLKSRV